MASHSDPQRTSSATWEGRITQEAARRLLRALLEVSKSSERGAVPQHELSLAQSRSWCPSCEQNMLLAAGCALEYLEIGGRRYRRLPYGDSHGVADPPVAPCSDCGVQLGHLHHPGCALERCPKCSGQWVSCPCGE